jgi:hypothetical protein
MAAGSDVDATELASQRVANTLLEKQLAQEEKLLAEAQKCLEKAQETIDTLSYVLPPLKEHAEMLKQEVKDVEMNTKSLALAKRNADLENIELRKMLKKDLEAYGKLRSQILRQEMERMVQDKAGKLGDGKAHVLKLAISCGSLQSRLSKLRDELATGVTGGESRSPSPRGKKGGLMKRPDSAAAKGRAYTPPPSAKPRLRSPATKRKEEELRKQQEQQIRRKPTTAEQRDKARADAGLKPLNRSRSPAKSPEAKSPQPGTRAWQLSSPFKGHTRGPYRASPAKGAAHGIPNASTRSRTPTKPSAGGEYQESRPYEFRGHSKPMEGGLVKKVDKQEEGGQLARDRALQTAWADPTQGLGSGLRPRRDSGMVGSRPHWAVVTREGYDVTAPQKPGHSGRDRTPQTRGSPAVVEIPLGGRYDPKIPPRDPRYAEPRYGAQGVNARIGPDVKPAERAAQREQVVTSPQRGRDLSPPVGGGKTPEAAAQAGLFAAGQSRVPQHVQSAPVAQTPGRPQSSRAPTGGAGVRPFAPPQRGEAAQHCPLCGTGRDELEHVLRCNVSAPVVNEWKEALEHAKVPVRVETILEPPDAVLLPTLQLVQELHRMRSAAGVSSVLPSS